MGVEDIDNGIVKHVLHTDVHQRNHENERPDKAASKPLGHIRARLLRRLRGGVLSPSVQRPRAVSGIPHRPHNFLHMRLTVYSLYGQRVAEQADPRRPDAFQLANRTLHMRAACRAGHALHLIMKHVNLLQYSMRFCATPSVFFPFLKVNTQVCLD